MDGNTSGCNSNYCDDHEMDATSRKRNRKLEDWLPTRESVHQVADQIHDGLSRGVAASRETVQRVSNQVADQIQGNVARGVTASRHSVQRVSNQVADQINVGVTRGVTASRQGVQTVIDRAAPHVAQVDRESLWRILTPFFLLLGWLTVGMIVFFVVESPNEEHRLENEQATKSDSAMASSSYERGRIFSSGIARIGEHTLAIDVNGNPFPSTSTTSNNISLATNSTQSDANNSTESVGAEQLLFQDFNKLFFYGSDRVEVLSVKITQSADSHGHMLVTVFYRNKTKNSDSGLLSKPNKNGEYNHRWDMPGALFFCLAVVTTIGYGNLAPGTYIGQFLCVLYAIIGIPLFLVVVEQMRTVLTRSLCRLHKVFFKLAHTCRNHSRTIIQKSSQFVPRKPRRRPVSVHRTPSALERYEAAVKEGIRKKEVRAATGVVAIFCCLLFIFVPSIFFSHTEGWDYLNSLYFSFISLTTIGFGDLIAGQRSGSSHPFIYGLYRLFLCVWLFFGIAFLATLNNIMQILIERLIERIHWKRRLAARKSAKRKSAQQHRDAHPSIEEQEEEADSEGSEMPNTVNLLDIIDSDVLCDLKHKDQSTSSGSKPNEGTGDSKL